MHNQPLKFIYTPFPFSGQIKFSFPKQFSTHSRLWHNSICSKQFYGNYGPPDFQFPNDFHSDFRTAKEEFSQTKFCQVTVCESVIIMACYENAMNYRFIISPLFSVPSKQFFPTCKWKYSFDWSVHHIACWNSTEVNTTLSGKISKVKTHFHPIWIYLSNFQVCT